MPLTRRTLTAVLAALLLAAPQASAKPADTHVRPGESTAAATTEDLRSPDARDAAAAATTEDLRSPDARDAAAAATTQDLRSPDARDAAAAATQDVRSPEARDAAAAATTQDLRSPDARDAANRDQSPTSSPAGTDSPRQNPNAGRTNALLGPPTSPANPQPITPAPAAAASDPDSGVDWTIIGLGLTGSLLLLGGLAVLTRRMQRVRATT